MVKVESKYYTDTEVKGRILGVRKVANRGRVQIPRAVKDILKIEDGDKVYWVEWGERIYVVKAVSIT